jgi:hypothetical protein
MIRSHFILYMLFFIYTAFLVGALVYNNNYFSGIDAVKDKIISQMVEVVKENFHFLMAKIYLRNGFSGQTIQFTYDSATMSFGQTVK